MNTVHKVTIAGPKSDQYKQESTVPEDQVVPLTSLAEADFLKELHQLDGTGVWPAFGRFIRSWGSSTVGIVWTTL